MMRTPAMPDARPCPAADLPLRALIRRFLSRPRSALRPLCLVLGAMLMLLCGAARAGFVVNADGTVTDAATGLTWDRCAWGQVWDGATCTGQALTLDWQQALQASVAANAAAHAGQTDWRVPNVRELESLLDFARFDPALDTGAFPNAPPTRHWTATPTWIAGVAIERSHVPYALVVDFADGAVERLAVADTSVTTKATAQLRLVRQAGVFDLKNTPAFDPYFALTLSASPAHGGTLNCAPNPVPAGATADCTVTAQPGYTLTSLLDNGNEVTGQLSNGVYRLHGVAAAHTLAATFTSTASTTQLSVSPGPSAFGQTVTLTATVASALPAGGTVEFHDGATLLGSAALIGSSARLDLSILAVGHHALRATYAGAGQLQGSASAVVDHVVSFTQGGSVGLPNPAGGGNVEVALASVAGDARCAITQLALTAALPAELPAGISFPRGLVDVALDGCGAGARATLRLVYPSALPANTAYWKYGPTPDNPAYHWYPMPAGTVQVHGNVVTLTLTDGAIGDDDLVADGRIVDIGGPALVAAAAGAPPTPIPLLHPVGLLALALLMLGATARTRRHQRR